MQRFSEQLAEIREFIDIRYDSLLDIHETIKSLEDAEFEDPDAAMQFLDALCLSQKTVEYTNRCNQVARGNYQLANALSNISLKGVKPVLGDDTYV